MKNTKGFVMIETIIVITILMVGLISLYSSYSVIISRLQVKNNYDNVEYIYKAYFVGDYLIDNNNVSTFTIYKPDTSINDLKFIIDNLSIDKIYVIPKNFDYKAEIPKLEGSSIAYFNKWNDYEKNKINIVVKFKSDDIPSKINFASVAFE
ncbi:MAG: prepilin-type N-terminal cleavage/methylation domain-containing protein [Bacilli bacterium]|nr:prepilin-type N-terminal cleavage/methylation domain-containing protein [Bacilli bacterium]MDD4406764.1 prepilin-type N-terminal cleavage/methylation domain-containing protein [Bacilli bacterium]